MATSSSSLHYPHTNLKPIGIHRGLGTHLTFVRSAVLDALKIKVVEQYQVLSKPHSHNSPYSHNATPTTTY
jgi:hypothetical protein